MTGFKALSVLLAGGAVLSLSACEDQATQPDAQAFQSQEMAVHGNGFPDGSHDFNLHIIGVPKDKTAAMDNNNGRRIFVQLKSDNEVTNPGGKNNHLGQKGSGKDQNKIFLCNSTNDENDSTDPRCADYGNPDNWGVIDANATDSDGALLAVPDPCEGEDSTDGCEPRWAVWARALAGGSAIITTCAEEEGDGFDDTDDVWCGDNGIELEPNHGRKAQDVSDNLLFMSILVDEETDPELVACIDPRIDTTDETFETHEFDVYLFDRCFENYFWNYDNNGLKNLELRFYWAG